MAQIPAQPVLDAMVAEITDELLQGLQEPISRSLRTLLNESLNKAVGDGEFYRRLNEEMMSGIQNIFKEITTAKTTPGKTPNKEQTDKLFEEASRQLDEILETTEEATTQIMTIVEKQLDLQEESDKLLAIAVDQPLTPEQAKRLGDINSSLGDDFTQILTALSFQDLTGQRIKKIISALEKIETTAFDLFISTGLALKAHKEEPGKDMETIKSEAKQLVSELKGPSRNSNQNDVDDLLAQLGL